MPIEDSKRNFPDWITAYLKYTDNTEPPESYKLWTGISVIASALQRKVRLVWGTALTFYPNMYIILVGPSGVRKSTAMSPGLELIEKTGMVQIAANSTSREALIRRLKDINYTEQDPLTGAKSYHSSMTIFSKEFAVFLGFHNREMMAALCDWYDCDRKWTYETISRNEEFISGVWVNLLGATTPDLIQSSLPLDAIGGGLTSRIIYVYEEKLGKIIEIPIQTKEEAELGELLFADLIKICKLSGRFKWTEAFQNKWSEWRRYIESHPPFKEKLLDGYCSRRPVHFLKLSMIFSASLDKGERELVLDVEDLDRAISTLLKVEHNMPRVFRGIAKSDLSSLISQSFHYILDLKSNGDKEISVSQFARYFGTDMDKQTMDNVIATLETQEMIKRIYSPTQQPILKIL